MTSRKFISFDFVKQCIFRCNFKIGGILRNMLFFWHHFLKLQNVRIMFQNKHTAISSHTSGRVWLPFDKLPKFRPSCWNRVCFFTNRLTNDFACYCLCFVIQMKCNQWYSVFLGLNSLNPLNSSTGQPKTKSVFQVVGLKEHEENTQWWNDSSLKFSRSQKSRDKVLFMRAGDFTSPERKIQILFS